MKALFTIGHFSIYIFGFFIAVGVLAGCIIALREGKRKNINQDQLLNILFYILIVGMVGARLYYVFVFNPNYYLNNPMKIFTFRDGGLSIQGALIAGILFALGYAKIKEINIWKVADVVAPGIILGQAIGRIGCDVFGVEMTSRFFWGVNINDHLLHPAQIYEAILNFILFGVLWGKRKSIKYDGQLFFIYLIGFSVNRFIVEFFRTNPIVIQPFTVAHVTSLIIVVVALIGMGILKSKNKEKPVNNRKNFQLNPVDIITILGMTVFFVAVYYWIWL